MDRVDRLSEGTRKELGRNSDDSEDLLIFRVLRGSCNLRPGRECQELQVGVARKRPEIFKFPKPTNCFTCHSFHVSSTSQIQTLKSTAFSLVHLENNTIFGFRSGEKWVVTSLRDLGFTTDAFSHASNVQLAESHSLACVARQVSQRCRATATWMQTAT